MAIRVAATLRLGQLIGEDGAAAAQLAADTGADEGALRLLLRQLVTAGLLEEDAGNYRVTDAGVAWPPTRSVSGTP
jgi:DNA-binding IclR family transcriptional regulator